MANRDSSDIAVIDTQTDQIVRRIALGKFANPHMAMLSHNGKKLLVSATGRDRFLVVDLATEAIERTIETGQAPEHFAKVPGQARFRCSFRALTHHIKGAIRADMGGPIIFESCRAAIAA